MLQYGWKIIASCSSSCRLLGIILSSLFWKPRENCLSGMRGSSSKALQVPWGHDSDCGLLVGEEEISLKRQQCHL